MKEVVIIDAARTPIGKYRGSLSSYSAVELGTFITTEILERTGINKEAINQVIFGNVLQAGNGQNVARQIAINSGIPVSVPAMTINEVCGSGMKSVILARQQIQLGEADLIIAGGVESMTRAPMIQVSDPENEKIEEISSMVNDGLTDAFSNTHMGLTAENVAKQFAVTRAEQDQYALASQEKAAKASESGIFKEEIIPISRNEEVFATDEAVRGNSTLEKLSTLRTVFAEDGTVTAGNASPLNDGASVLILASKDYAIAHDLPYLATIKGVSEVGIDPSIMGVAPIKAIHTLMEKTGLSLDDIDLFEINEAFAASSIVVNRELNLPSEKVNIYGGAIALGHPIGASGARILTTLGYALRRQHQRYGVASLCIGGGLGLAVLLEANLQETGDNEKKKFYELTPEQRRQRLVQEKVISQAEATGFKESVLTEDIANHLIENQISQVEIPLGVALNFQVNGQKKWIPMATEEPSVIAAASNGAKMCGNISVQIPQRLMRGQIVLTGRCDYRKIKEVIEARKPELITCANESYPSIVNRGGGVREISTREFMGSEHAYLSLDFLVDVKDAMGANIINSILEGVAIRIKEWFPEEEILFSILSNLATESLAIATCMIPFERLAKDKETGQLIAEKIRQASEYAKLDPYRATTHNKGIMNGIEAVILATGNDTRAAAAAIHAYAARNGSYQGLTDWQIKENHLVGKLTVPLAVATVGGASRVLPKAKASLDMLAIDSAQELAQVIAAVGLAQNLAALRALVSDGIQKGHMSLQARALAITVGAKGDEIERVAAKLRESGTINQQSALAALAAIQESKN
ncbi:hydroxymethylglutaryl-CoA reductase, degradative [Enterococcus mundtii]|uniref:hydroxymethylglutaryl-CoA reductase, degradative n=1 Tax=Enterococcus mundtii TaxID=53346 RepID=UPI001378E517|nr:hydroxymethylglutaryl-CoA reductase, degradative [Enterococcus mundtii]NBA62022.1 hydroxymethylglutaryl-CoA reductase, degradative [Enterococcus mundtii]